MTAVLCAAGRRGGEEGTENWSRRDGSIGGAKWWKRSEESGSPFLVRKGRDQDPFLSPRERSKLLRQGKSVSGWECERGRKPKQGSLALLRWLGRHCVDRKWTRRRYRQRTPSTAIQVASAVKLFLRPRERCRLVKCLAPYIMPVHTPLSPARLCVFSEQTSF